MPTLDRKIVENSKVVIVNGYMNNINSFNQNINLEFVPNEVVLKFVSAQIADTNAVGAYTYDFVTINTNLGFTDNNNIFSFVPMPAEYSNAAGVAPLFVGVFNSITDVNIKLPMFDNKMYNFTLTTSGNGTINFAQSDTYIALTFEFIKYKSMN